MPVEGQGGCPESRDGDGRLFLTATPVHRHVAHRRCHMHLAEQMRQVCAQQAAKCAAHTLHYWTAAAAPLHDGRLFLKHRYGFQDTFYTDGACIVLPASAREIFTQGSQRTQRGSCDVAEDARRGLASSPVLVPLEVYVCREIERMMHKSRLTRLETVAEFMGTPPSHSALDPQGCDQEGPRGLPTHPSNVWWCASVSASKDSPRNSLRNRATYRGYS